MDPQFHFPRRLRSRGQNGKFHFPLRPRSRLSLSRRTGPLPNLELESKSIRNENEPRKNKKISPRQFRNARLRKFELRIEKVLVLFERGVGFPASKLAGIERPERNLVGIGEVIGEIKDNSIWVLQWRGKRVRKRT